MDNYYQLLGIARAATPVEVKAAFQAKMKALEASPVHGEHREAQEKMLRQAFLTLLDPGKRSRYDHQVDAAARPVVVLQEVEKKGLSVTTMTLVAILLVGTVVGGWYVTNPSAKKREAERKHDEELARAAREKVEREGPRNRNPNPFRDGPPNAVKDQMMKNAIDRASKEAKPAEGKK